MKCMNIIFGYVAMTSSLAFGLDLSLGNGENRQIVQIGNEVVVVNGLGGKVQGNDQSALKKHNEIAKKKHHVRNEDDEDGQIDRDESEEDSQSTRDNDSKVRTRPAQRDNVNVKTEKFPSLSFNKLRLDVNANLHIHLGDRIAVDIGNDEAAITVGTNMGMLTLSSGSGSISSDTSVDVWAQQLDAVVLDSASDIDLDNVQQHDLEVILNGSGNIRLTGHVDNLIATINGSGDLNLEGLVAENATVKINGAGTANINVRRVLKANISGAGDIRYSGNPGRVIPKVTGAGSVERL